ncbi:A/G-specific adenine glycosylase [Vitreoscilla sp. C1]|uniref:A/G-specific adenine glycosylase n=1 Tax=Vitreoscilla sp. (strain C1) TaxID=96942 RepID=UPI00148EBC08|nr:A/G-specific adenine glycosylase [Vitreoscilla sp. C1]
MSSESFSFNLNKAVFSTTLLKWQRQHGRNDLPWQQRNPYLVWVSEIMLQQTQVKTVLDYYPRFTARFPDVHTLAQAHSDDVTALWAGLGYYSRARNLHHAAKQVVQDFNGQFPSERESLQQLKGVGRSTAAAISAFAFHQRETILDGNVKRVLCRIFAQFGNPQDKAFENQLWTLAESLIPQHPQDMPAYTQGLMDLGATVCTRSKPKCTQCPMQKGCEAYAKNLTDVLPQRKTPVKIQELPLKWLCLINQKQEIWLHKRPESGIWSQLYCVPSIDESAWLPYLQKHSLHETAMTALAPITHKLTHRHMRITPYILHTNSERIQQMHIDGQFYSLQDALKLGLPKPLQQHLSTFMHLDWITKSH